MSMSRDLPTRLRPGRQSCRSDTGRQICTDGLSRLLIEKHISTRRGTSFFSCLAARRTGWQKLRKLSIIIPRGYVFYDRRAAAASKPRNRMSTLLPCFKAYDIRGRVPDVLNAPLAHALGRAVAEVLPANNVVLGRDARLS
ncbi:hypothetical protein V6C07_09705, partial [Desulfovibrio sp. 1214_IL3152]